MPITPPVTAPINRRFTTPINALTTTLITTQITKPITTLINTPTNTLITPLLTTLIHILITTLDYTHIFPRIITWWAAEIRTSMVRWANTRVIPRYIPLAVCDRASLVRYPRGILTAIVVHRVDPPVGESQAWYIVDGFNSPRPPCLRGVKTWARVVDVLNFRFSRTKPTIASSNFFNVFSLS
eukprot:TRINITY_DN6005_c0_g1_i12.p2 TRINITY_DN6005_c0_g1~~TRINITY_DN6005_c0_g1_i12.p2  ORF type:complete len:183 (+),score=25.32 TRINITY_DN6005_c0_g1_i12:114-662(+)